MEMKKSLLRTPKFHPREWVDCSDPTCLSTLKGNETELAFEFAWPFVSEADLNNQPTSVGGIQQPG